MVCLGSSVTELMRLDQVTRPRRLEAFTTDSKIIRLISRRVVVFPAAARQFFDGECDSANMKIYLHLCGPLRHCTDCLRCRWSNLVTLPSRPTVPGTLLSGVSGRAPIEIKFGAFYPENPTSGIWSNKRALKFSDCVEKLNMKSTAAARKKIDGGLTGQSTTSTPSKFDSISRRNSTAPGSAGHPPAADSSRLKSKWRQIGKKMWLLARPLYYLFSSRCWLPPCHLMFLLRVGRRAPVSPDRGRGLTGLGGLMLSMCKN